MSLNLTQREDLSAGIAAALREDQRFEATTASSDAVMVRINGKYRGAVRVMPTKLEMHLPRASRSWRRVSFEGRTAPEIAKVIRASFLVYDEKRCADEALHEKFAREREERRVREAGYAQEIEGALGRQVRVAESANGEVMLSLTPEEFARVVVALR